MQTVATQSATRTGALHALGAHWPEYLMEGAALALFMISACLFTVLLEHPGSPLHRALPDASVRRILGGIAMGLTAVALICSPWGQRSGAHMNPAFTLAFLSIGKIAAWDAFFYVAAQFAGGAAGVILCALALPSWIGHPAVNYVVTVPGLRGPWVAFGAEFAISFLLVAVILSVANSPRATRFTPWVAGFLIAAYISFEAPLSGMSMNPARTVGSALPAANWTAIWVYLLAPPLAMLLAAQIRGAHSVFCAKLHHHNRQRCIFRCNYGAIDQ